MELQQFKTDVLPIRDKIYSYSLRMLNNMPEAEDTVQEVFLKLWMMREKLMEYHSIEALSIQMTKNICLNKLQFQKRYKQEDLFQIADISNGDNAATRIEISDEVNLIEKIIRTLPELQQIVIRMRDIEEYELNEIAEITGCKIEAVRMNLSRARKKVRELFLETNKISRL